VTTTPTHFTVEDYERLPEGFPCELIEGEPLTTGHWDFKPSRPAETGRTSGGESGKP